MLGRGKAKPIILHTDIDDELFGNYDDGNILEANENNKTAIAPLANQSSIPDSNGHVKKSFTAAEILAKQKGTSQLQSKTTSASASRKRKHNNSNTPASSHNNINIHTSSHNNSNTAASSHNIYPSTTKTKRTKVVSSSLSPTSSPAAAEAESVNGEQLIISRKIDPLKFYFIAETKMLSTIVGYISNFRTEVNVTAAPNELRIACMDASHVVYLFTLVSSADMKYYHFPIIKFESNEQAHFDDRDDDQKHSGSAPNDITMGWPINRLNGILKATRIYKYCMISYYPLQTIRMMGRSLESKAKDAIDRMELLFYETSDIGPSNYITKIILPFIDIDEAPLDIPDSDYLKLQCRSLKSLMHTVKDIISGVDMNSDTADTVTFNIKYAPYTSGYTDIENRLVILCGGESGSMEYNIILKDLTQQTTKTQENILSGLLPSGSVTQMGIIESLILSTGSRIQDVSVNVHMKYLTLAVGIQEFSHQMLYINPALPLCIKTYLTPNTHISCHIAQKIVENQN